MKILSLLPFSLIFFNLASAHSLADQENVKLSVASQTFQCSIANQQLNCKPLNQPVEQTVDLAKNNGKFTVADTDKGLSLDISTTLDGGNVNYNLTECSNTVCTLNNVYSDSSGSINQVIAGQYNLTEASFYVLGVSLTNQNKILNIGQQLAKIQFSK